jgi:membrane protein YqaA with SNARE-associated domain
VFFPLSEIGADVAPTLWGLFVSAFISSTIAPGGSEAILGWLVSQGSISPGLLVVTATVGNTLGALTTWVLGLLGSKGVGPGWFAARINETAMIRVRSWGVPALFFSWLPVIGDALCFAAGWLRLPFLLSLVAIVAGKFLRYVVIAVAVS